MRSIAQLGSMAAVVLMLGALPAHAATISFLTDPFAGSTALTTPGRQIVGAETFLDFDIASDVYLFDPAVFGISAISFANDVIGNVPTSGVNTVVLQTFDNDGDPTTAFLAGTAANLIADQIVSAGPGFFIYFNSNLDLPRLVYSTDLSDNTADLKVLARMQNLVGDPGRAAIPTFSEANFALAEVPEPSSLLLLGTGFLALCGAGWRKRRQGNIGR